ncbi:hypothetical protein Q7P35_010596 [Cladosporium inversicolor]
MTADGTANEFVNGRANGHTNGHTNKAANESSKGVAMKPGHQSSIQPSVEVATSPNDADAVSSTIESIQALGKTFTPTDNFGRQKLLAEARRLVRALETPRETMIKHNWAQPAAHMAITLGVDLGLFGAMLEDDSSSKSVTELGKMLRVDPGLLARTMRHISAMGYIEETAADEYKPTNFSRSLAIPIISDGYPCIAGGAIAALSKFNLFAAKTGYAEPSDAENSPYQYAYDTKLNFFAYLQANPPYGPQFNHHMGGYSQGRPKWMDADFFPVQERLVKGAKSEDDAVFVVDIGGSIGHDLADFAKKHPNTPGRLVLQDLPVVLGQIESLDDTIERMAYDFYTEQPLLGARAYYMHSVLHDWPDDVCERILANVKNAMERGYSKLLINENVIPDVQAHWEATALDMMMLALFASKERTAAQWKHLLEDRAGLKIVKIWGVDNGVESLIECELP